MRSHFCSFLSQLEPREFHVLSLWSDCTAVGATTEHPFTHLDQPKRGGAAQEKAIIQVKAMPIMAWDAEKRKFPMGLQTTM